MDAYFAETIEGDAAVLQPLQLARSGWGASIRGMAVSVALVRAAEAEARSAGLAEVMMPTRWTLELLRPAGLVPTQVSAVIVRQGRRAAVIDAHMRQGGVLVARATALYARPSEAPIEGVWSPSEPVAPPEPGILPASGDRRIYHTPSLGWSRDPSPHQNAERKQIWCGDTPAVAGDAPSPFRLAAGVADVASMATNWGSAGLVHINADVSMHLARLPHGEEAGLRAITRSAVSGIAVGTAEMFDRDGVFGTVTTSAFANPAHAVDMRLWRPEGWA